MNGGTAPPSPADRPRPAGPWIVAALLAVAAGRVLVAQTVFSPTTDQYIHLFTGSEWLDRGSYEFEPLHPPLARVVLAALPYSIAGLRLPPEAREFRCPSFVQTLKHLRPSGKRFACMSSLPLDIRAFLQQRPDYERLYRLAGAGTLGFLLVAAVVVWRWTAALHGEGTAVLATLLITTMPVVLGHAGIATTDMALVATLPGALWAFHRLWARPSFGRSLAFGAAVGLAVLSKYTALLFLPPCLLVVAVLAGAPDRPPSPRRRPWLLALVATLAAALVVWAGYRFSTGAPVDLVPGLADRAAAIETSWLRGLAQRLAAARVVPAPEFAYGLYDAWAKERGGHAYYVLGRPLDREGVWYFFPVALLFKTTLPALLAFLIGTAIALWRRYHPALLPSAIVAAIVLAAMPTRVNVGVRHVLAVYPLLCMTAAWGLRELWAFGPARGAMRALAAALVAGHLGASVIAHPDYLSYFNVLAGGHPEDVLLDSDLDWGQDMKRLANTIRSRGIEEITVCCAGEVSMAPYHHGAREIHHCPDAPVAGWVAVSVNQTKVFRRDALAWLGGLEPVERVGTSILLYYVPARDPRGSK